MQFVFPTNVLLDQAQVDAGFAHRLILKDGAVTAIKDPGHDGKWNGIKCMCFVGDRAQELVTL